MVGPAKDISAEISYLNGNTGLSEKWEFRDGGNPAKNSMVTDYLDDSQVSQVMLKIKDLGFQENKNCKLTERNTEGKRRVAVNLQDVSSRLAPKTSKVSKYATESLEVDEGDRKAGDDSSKSKFRPRKRQGAKQVKLDYSTEQGTLIDGKQLNPKYRKKDLLPGDQQKVDGWIARLKPCVILTKSSPERNVWNTIIYRLINFKAINEDKDLYKDIGKDKCSENEIAHEIIGITRDADPEYPDNFIIHFSRSGKERGGKEGALSLNEKQLETFISEAEKLNKELVEQDKILYAEQQEFYKNF